MKKKLNILIFVLVVFYLFVNAYCEEYPVVLVPGALYFSDSPIEWKETMKELDNCQIKYVVAKTPWFLKFMYPINLQLDYVRAAIETAIQSTSSQKVILIGWDTGGLYEV